MTNEQRADSIRNILPDFKSFAGLVGEPDAEVIGDLLANLAHYADAEDINLALALNRARGDYDDETNSKGEQFDAMTIDFGHPTCR